MKVIFLSIGGFKSISTHDQYPDLLREFQCHGHEVYVVCSNEKRTGLPTELVEEQGAKILRVRIGNITQSGLIEKGIATVMIEYQYRVAIDKFFNNIKFDLILYTTPPISLANIVFYLKKKNQAVTYLILKDIFPQNAVDLGILRTTGVKGILYRYFRNQEKRLYANSNMIGAMSEANRNYLLVHNRDIDSNKVEICPNCIEVHHIEILKDEKTQMRKKYGIPEGKKVFVYGGNLGKPQNIPFVIQCIKEAKIIKRAFFWIIGNGTEFSLLDAFVRQEKPENFKLSSRLPKEDYDKLVASCDVGLIFLDSRFTIPNFPSRMLSYMQAGIPVLACTDNNSDIGQTIVDGGFGWACKSNNTKQFIKLVKKITHEDTSLQAQNARKHINDYSVDRCYKIIDESVARLLNGDTK